MKESVGCTTGGQRVICVPSIAIAWNPIACVLAALVATSLVSTASQPPTRPTGLTLSGKSGDSVSLYWTVSSDDVAVTSYSIWRDGHQVGSSSSNAFVAQGLVENRSYTFRVRAHDGDGNISDFSNALLTTPQSGGSPPPLVVRTQYTAMVLNYEPHVYVNGSYVPLADYYALRNVDLLVSNYMHFLKNASGGQVIWSVGSRFDLDEFPAPANSSQPHYDATNYLSLRATGYDYGLGGVDYAGIIHDPRFGILEKANAGELDAVWIFGLPGTGFYETAMAGWSAYYVNGGPIVDASLTRNIIIYGFGKEAHQGVGFMAENMSHMAEVIMKSRITPDWPRSTYSRVFNTLNIDNPVRTLVSTPVNDWSYFTQADSLSWDPLLVAPEDSQAGLSHFPPTAILNYGWYTERFPFLEVSPFRVYDGTWSAENGQLHVSSGNGGKVLAFEGFQMWDDLGSYYPPMAFSSGDVEFGVRLGSDAASSHAGFLFRVSECRAGFDQVKGYYVGISAALDQLLLAKLDNGFTPLATASFPIETNRMYRMRMELRRGEMKLFVDSFLTPVLSAYDESYVTGGFGFASYGSEAWFTELSIVAKPLNFADNWYTYPESLAGPRHLSPLEWNGDTATAMDNFYRWWWEHLPKNGGGHYVTDVQFGNFALILDTWWPYIFDINNFTSTRPAPDIVFAAEDVTPPAAPTSLSAFALEPTSVGLFWSNAVDNVGVTRYAVYRNGVLVRKTALPHFTDTQVMPGSNYVYTVKACDGSGNVSASGASMTVATPAGAPAKGQIINGGFEWHAEASGWFTEGNNHGEAQFLWEAPGSGRRGGRAVSIASARPNDAFWRQTVKGLQPGVVYWLTAWIKGEGVTLAPGAVTAANIGLVGTWVHSGEVLTGTFDWRQVSLAFAAPPSGIVTVGLRLGYWSSLASGKVWFDDVTIVPSNEIRLGPLQVQPDHTVRFEMFAAPGPYEIQVSYDLRNWSHLQTITAISPVTEITDTMGAIQPVRFYRAVRGP